MKSTNIERVTSVVLGEPSAKLVVVPSGYEELPPSQALGRELEVTYPRQLEQIKGGKSQFWSMPDSNDWVVSLQVQTEGK